MKSIRFVHCADLHIDSPFQGISAIDPGLGKMLRHSTYQAFNNIVDLAIREKVDCVLISGDIYDSADKSLRAQLKFRDGLNRLSNEGISTFIVCGNHDPLNGWSATLEWPKNVFPFPGDRVQCWPLQRNGEIIAQIYGISFTKGDISENLALKFPRVDESVPCIGLLHTNIGANTGHMPYSPCTVEDLSTRGMDYWALGHIHAHTILKTSNPAIVYPGCSQSRHPGESGEKGCCLVALESGTDPDIQFIPTDIIRHKSDVMDITNYITIDDVISSIEKKCEEIVTDMGERHAIIRLSLIGRTDLHTELHRGNIVGDILERVREDFEGRTPWIWLEKLTLSTTGTYDLETLRSGNDFIADIISIYDELEDAESESWQEIQGTLAILFSNWQGKNYIEELSKEKLLELARQARGLTLDKLMGTE
ncbi:MAG: DNA repair exonuclease [Dehalococcoidia bacterium]|nr:DNA repair exonuclease [Dehalococcoidia bacterium]